MRIQSAASIFHEAVVITDNIARNAVPRFTETPVFTAGMTMNSGMNFFEAESDRVMAIDIRVESMGANADLIVEVESTETTPEIIPVRF